MFVFNTKPNGTYVPRPCANFTLQATNAQGLGTRLAYVTLVNPFPVCILHFEAARKSECSTKRAKCLATSTCKPSLRRASGACPVKGSVLALLALYINGAKVVMTVVFLSCSSIQQLLLLVNITYRVLFQFPPCVLFQLPQYSSSSYQHCCHFMAKV